STPISEVSADTEDKTTSVEKAAVSAQSPTSEQSKLDKVQPQTNIDTHPARTASFAEKLSSRIDKPAASENKKLAQTKQSIETAKDTSTDDTQTSSAVEPDQTQQPAPAPQNIDDAIKAVIPQAVVLEHSVNGSALAH